MTEPNTVLDELDLEKLTGYKQARRQVLWLEEKHIGYTLDRHGRPRTTLGLYERALTRLREYGYKPPT